MRPELAEFAGERVRSAERAKRLPTHVAKRRPSVRGRVPVKINLHLRMTDRQLLGDTSITSHEEKVLFSVNTIFKKRTNSYVYPTQYRLDIPSMVTFPNIIDFIFTDVSPSDIKKSFVLLKVKKKLQTPHRASQLRFYNLL